MTDDEYQRLLAALGAKHLRMSQSHHGRQSYQGDGDLRERLEDISSLARLVNAAAADRRPDEDLQHLVARRLLEELPIENTMKAMDETGLLDALDDAPTLVFRKFERCVIPAEDTELLKRAGFSDAEIEVLLALAVDYAHQLAHDRLYWANATFQRPASRVLEEAAEAMRRAVEKLSTPAEAPKKKRKLFNGIGKLLGGSVMGIGNALVATGTILAPNPATGSIAIASGAGAIASILAGVGDLRGE